MKKWLYVLLALCTAVAMIGCPTEGDSDQITITKDFNYTGGGTTTVKIAKDGSLSASQLAAPTRAGFTFTGWTNSPSGGTAVTTATVFSADATIYAQWTAGGATEKVTVTAEGGAAYIIKGESLQLTAVVEPSGTAQTVTWQIVGSPAGFTIDATGLLTAPATTSLTSVTVVAESTVLTDVSGTLSLSVLDAITGPIDEGGKDAIANAGFERTKPKVWSMAEDWAEENEEKTVSDSTSPINNAGTADFKVVNGGINIKGRTNDYSTIDIRLIGARGIPGVVLTDYKYKVTVYGIILKESSEAIPQFGNDGSPYASVGDPAALSSGTYPTFKLVLEETPWDLAATGLRVMFGTGNMDDVRITLIEIEEVGEQLACECSGCALNGKRIGESIDGGYFCTACDGENCAHGCYVCKRIGAPYIPPTEDTTVPYEVPSAGDGFFYLDLNNVDQLSSINTIAKPIIRSSAGQVIYTFNHENQILGLKLSDEEAAKVHAAAAAGTLGLQINGIASSATTQFRYCFGRNAGSNWNRTTMNGNGVLSNLLSQKEAALNDPAIPVEDIQYFVFQHRSIANTDVTIKSIRVILDPSAAVEYEVPAAGDGFFYLNLNSSYDQYDVTNNGNPGGIDKPGIAVGANSVAYSFSLNNQQLWIKLTAEQIGQIWAASEVKIKINGTATPDADFRSCFARQAGASWNVSSWVGGAAPVKIAELTTETTLTPSNAGFASADYLIIQLREASSVELTIESIKVSVSGISKVNLGEFTAVNSDTQKGWLTNGTDGKTSDLTAESLTSAKFLVLECTTLPAGGVQVIWQGNGDGWTWNQNAITSDKGEPDAEKGTLVDGNKFKIELSKAFLKYDLFVASSQIKFFLAYYSPNPDALGITKAYLEL